MKGIALIEIFYLMVLVIIPILRRHFHHQFDPLEPIVIILAAYSIFYILKPLDIVLAGRYSIHPMEQSLYVLALLYCVVGLVSFLIGYHTKFPKVVAKALPQLPELKSNTSLMLAVAFLLLLGFAGFGMKFRSLSDFISYLAVSHYGRGPAMYVIEAVICSGLLSSFIILFFVLYAASLTVWQRSRLAKIAAGVSGLWALTLFNPFSWSRASLSQIVIGWLIIRHYLKKPFRTLTLVSISIVFIAFYVFFGMFRHAGPTAVKWQQGPAAIWNNLMSKRYLDAFENFAFILDTFPNYESFLLGETYWALLVNWIPRVFWPTAHIFVHGPHCKEQLISQGVNPSKISVIYHGELGSFFKQISCVKDVRREEKTVLFFGELRPNKGVELLIPIADRIHVQFPDVKFVVAGSPKVSRDLKRSGWEIKLRAILQEMRSRPYFEVHDRFIPDEEVASFFQRASVTLLPYLDATQSGVAMVAMPLGSVVVATRVGDLPYVIQDGKTGFLAEANVESIVVKLSFVLSHVEEMQRIRDNARTWAKQECNWDRIAGQAVEVYGIICRAQGRKVG